MKHSVSNKSRSLAHPRGYAPVPYLLVEFGEGAQGAQGFLVGKRFENTVALLQWKARVGRRRRFPFNAGWSGTHACAVRTTKIRIHRIRA